METKKKVAVYFDGSNFYYKLRELEIPNITHFDYGKFSEWLARDREIISKRYYVGTVRASNDNEKGQKLRKEQQRLFSHLTSADQNFIVKQGYIMNNDGSYHEKGVDVKIAVDLLVGAYENIYDTAILISSDTDLIPAIQKIKFMGKKVEYIGFSHRPSLAMQKHASLSRLIIKEELEVFIPKDLLTIKNK